MIIINQDEDSIYNFDNIKSIDVVDNRVYITDDILADKKIRLGEYKTEERANEVLVEIMQSYIDSTNYIYMNKFLDTDEFNRLQRGLVYEMPKK